MTFGHEFSALVEEIGEGVEGFKVGDRVCVEPIIWDGTCPSCLKGVHNACDKGGFIGLSGRSLTWHFEILGDPDLHINAAQAGVVDYPSTASYLGQAFTTSQIMCLWRLARWSNH